MSPMIAFAVLFGLGFVGGGVYYADIQQTWFKKLGLLEDDNEVEAKVKRKKSIPAPIEDDEDEGEIEFFGEVVEPEELDEDEVPPHIKRVK